MQGLWYVTGLDGILRAGYFNISLWAAGYGVDLLCLCGIRFMLIQSLILENSHHRIMFAVPACLLAFPKNKMRGALLLSLQSFNPTFLALERCQRRTGKWLSWTTWRGRNQSARRIWKGYLEPALRAWLWLVPGELEQVRACPVGVKSIPGQPQLEQMHLQTTSVLGPFLHT